MCVIVGTFQPEGAHTVCASFDGGQSWPSVLEVKADKGFIGDPACSFGPDGSAYSSVINDDAYPDKLVVHYSKDGGHTWNPSTVPLPHSFIDRDHIIAHGAHTKHRGRADVYGQFA